MRQIQLNFAAWTIDENDPLGPAGGFGAVFRGRSGNGDEVAIKRLHITAGNAANRELHISDVLRQRAPSGVVPVLDFGQDADSDQYFIVMPVCDGSLRDFLDANGPATIQETASILVSVTSALLAVGDIVHRDLKPGNILRYRDAWCIADFGIAKFVEDATSMETLRDVMTAGYAAPEQWRGERPTHATDVYALGCIAHVVRTGSPPFRGGKADLCEAHLKTVAPPLNSGNSSLDAFVQQMLRKPAEVRPTLSRCEKVLGELATPQAATVHVGLASANKKIGERKAMEEAAAARRAAQIAARAAVAQDGLSELQSILERLYQTIHSEAGVAERAGPNLVLGGAVLRYEMLSPVTLPQDEVEGPYFGLSKWDIAAWCSIGVMASDFPNSHAFGMNSYSWSATLFFSRAPQDEQYRWREVSFFKLGGDSIRQPFALSAESRDFHLALSPTMAGARLAYGPLTIDAEDEEKFRSRWISLFAMAAEGLLGPQSQMPIPDLFLSKLERGAR